MKSYKFLETAVKESGLLDLKTNNEMEYAGEWTLYVDTRVKDTKIPTNH